MQRLKSELARLANTCRWSWQGWCAAWATEKSLRQWAGLNVLSALLAFALDLTAAERALILALGLMVLVVELANTAFEELVDQVMPDPHPRAKKIKDCASAAVAVTAIAGGVAWLVILLG